MDLLEEYGTDPVLEQEGVWSNEFRGGIEMKLRSSQSKEVKAAYARQSKRSERFWKTKQPVPESIEKKNQADIAAAAVADWRHRTTVYDANGDVEREDVIATIPLSGEQLACTDDNKERVFRNPRLWSLALDVIGQINMIDRYKQEEVKTDVGNSPALSAPPSSSAVTATE